MNSAKIAGIDYGSKLAGTTVIAFEAANGKIAFATSEKNQDADRFIVEWAKIHQPNFIFLDAPLSLPGIYQKLPDCHDYFYRAADRAVQAMSPMFLGGLTARAIQLQNTLQTIGIQTIEVYPGHLAKTLSLNKDCYKKERAHIPSLLEQLLAFFEDYLAAPRTVSAVPTTWHHFDALLALLSGIRYLRGEHSCFGNPEEGLIVV